MFTCFAALCVAMVFNCLTQYLNQDEEQFVTAAYLAQHMRLYTDFLYLQPPIYPLVLSKLLMLFSRMSPFLVARLLCAALAIGTVVVFFDLAARLAESVRFAFILASLFASAPLMLLAYGLARNDIMPIFFGLCGVWFVLCGFGCRAQTIRSSFGFLFGWALHGARGRRKGNRSFHSFKRYALYIFFRAKPQLLPLVSGGAVGSLPIVYYAATAFDKFLYCNATFHLTVTTEFFTDIGRQKSLHGLIG